MASQKEQLEELLASYIDGTLSDDERRAVDSYLDGHPDMRRDLNEAMADSRALQTMPHISAPAGLTDSMQQHVERDALLGDSISSRATGRNYALPKFAIAAILIAGLGVGYFVFDKISSERGKISVALEAPKAPERNDSAKPIEAGDDAMRDETTAGQGTSGPGMMTQSERSTMTAPAATPSRSMAFRNIAPTSDPDILELREDQLTLDGRPLMKLSVNTKVVEAAEMSLAGFVSDNKLELASPSTVFDKKDEQDRAEPNVSEPAGAEPAKEKQSDPPMTADSIASIREASKSQPAPANSPLETETAEVVQDQVRRVMLVKNIRVDQIDTLRQLVDRAPGSSEAILVAVDNPDITAMPAGAIDDARLQVSQTTASWNELERSAYRARPGDRLRVKIDDPESLEKTEEILTIDSEGKITERGVSVNGADLPAIEKAMTDDLEMSRALGAARPKVSVDPLAPMPESVHFVPEQVVDLLVVIEGPQPLPPTTTPIVTPDLSEAAAFEPSTQPSP